MAKRNELVELYRFIMALSIVAHHIIYYAGAGDINNLRFGVEFFFILSGFLLINHCEKKPNESMISLMKGKIVHFYPYMVVIYLAAAVVVAIEKQENYGVILFQYLHQLLFLSNLFKEKVSYLRGTGQLWFVLSQLWATLILSWILKVCREAYRAVALFLVMITGYAAVIRCSGNLTTNVNWKIGEGGNIKIYVSLTLCRAMAGMACGMLAYLIFRKLSGYVYTKFAKNGGTLLSIVSLCMGLCLSARPKDAAINSYSWRSLLVVLLYAAAILLAFTFAQNVPQNKICKAICQRGGKWSLMIYVTHLLTIYMTIDAKISYGKKYWVIVFAGTAVASVLLELCVKLLRKGWAAFMVWLKKMCIAEPIE